MSSEQTDFASCKSFACEGGTPWTQFDEARLEGHTDVVLQVDFQIGLFNRPENIKRNLHSHLTPRQIPRFCQVFSLTPSNVLRLDGETQAVDVFRPVHRSYQHYETTIERLRCLNLRSQGRIRSKKEVLRFHPMRSFQEQLTQPFIVY